MARKSNSSRSSQSETSGAAATEATEQRARSGRGSASRARSQNRGGASRHAGNGKASPDDSETTQQRSESQREAFRQKIVRPGQSRRSSSGLLVEAGSVFVESIRQHAIPVALMGAGLAWLLLETRTAREAEAKLLEQARGVAGRVGEALSGLAETAREAYEEASESTQETIGAAKETMRERAQTLAEYAQGGASSVSRAVRDGVSTIGESAQTGLEASRDAVANVWEQHPLAVGASLLAAGVATGLLLPASVREGRIFGNAARRLNRTVQSKGAEFVDKSKELVSTSADVMAREARRFGLPARSRSRGNK